MRHSTQRQALLQKQVMMVMVMVMVRHGCFEGLFLGLLQACWCCRSYPSKVISVVQSLECSLGHCAT